VKKVVLMGVPHHNNLGDHAIVIAERQYLFDNFKDYEYYEISEETLEKCVEKAKKFINNEDILFLHGGGNLGDEYIYVEEARRKVIELFPDNIIVFFPQTMHFSDTEKGRNELQKSKEIYSKHKKLLIVAREDVSYQKMKREFVNNNVIKTPDIVTYLEKTEHNPNRDGALLILRNDIEANLEKDQIENIEKIVKKYFDKIEYDDTAKGEGISSKHREARIDKMLDKYRAAKLVITDRLHGMIFAAITTTPCIALGNYNHKIEACSKTLEHLEYIKYVNNLDEIEETIKYLLENDFEKYYNDFAVEQFKQIKEEVLKYEKN